MDELSKLHGKKYGSFGDLAKAIADSSNTFDSLQYLDTELGLVEGIGDVPTSTLPLDFANRWVAVRSNVHTIPEVSWLRLREEGFDHRFVINVGLLKSKIMLCDTEMIECWKLAFSHSDIYAHEILPITCAMRFVHRLDKLSSRFSVCYRLLRNGELMFLGLPDQAWSLVEGYWYSPTKCYRYANGFYHILLLPYWLKQIHPLLLHFGDWWYLESLVKVKALKMLDSRRARRAILNRKVDNVEKPYPIITRHGIDFST